MTSPSETREHATNARMPVANEGLHRFPSPKHVIIPGGHDCILGGGSPDPTNTLLSRDSWMYPYQRTPMGNPYII